MEISQLYQFVLILVLVGLLVGVGVLVLDKFAQTTGVTADAAEALNASRDAIGDIAKTWLGLIVVIGIMAIIIFMVIKSFSGQSR